MTENRAIVEKSFGAIKPDKEDSEKEAVVSSFLDYFRKGSAGRDVFMEHIIPLLTLDDLIEGSRTCRQMNIMCRTYTVIDVLESYGMGSLCCLHKVHLGKLILASVPSKDVCKSARRHFQMIQR